MDIHSNLEFLCRVCAANTKGKNSVAECVYILKTAGLKDKLDKFLYLKISDNDSLPKVLCKSCFRQVEATASLSKIAKDTQQVFRDFLLSNLPKGPSESTNTSEFTSSDFSAKKDSNKKSRHEETTALTQQVSPPAIMLAPPPPLLQPLTTTNRKEEVVVNVSVSDPLTRDNQQKMISNSQRRQSLLLESRYTPKSIAQKPATAHKLMPPKSLPAIEATITTSNSKSTTPTLNFYPINKTPTPGKQQPSQPSQTAEITTFSSGGYVIGRFNTNNSGDKEEPKKITMSLAPTADNVLQQKRKNLVKALNNIKANNSGQVSLLKSSQQKQAAALQNATKVPLAEVVTQTDEDELPDKIIIAAPKNKNSLEKCKREPLNLSSKIPAVIVAAAAAASQSSVSTATTATITPVIKQQQQPEQAVNFNNTSPKAVFPEDILLGRVIRDMDLLKLILKALKWPVNKQNMELQIQRLKNSKFTDIMSDHNLLQDTDLTQLLGPYLAPVLLAAQALQQQQQQILKTAALSQNLPAAFAVPAKISALEAAQAEINKSIPYKLPPETSVQLVPATPEEAEPTPSPPLNTLSTTITTTVTPAVKRQKDITALTVPQKRQRRSAAQRASIVISDEEDASTEEESPKKSRQRSSKIQIDLNTNFMAQLQLLNASAGDEANKALMELLQKQKAAIMKDKKVQRRRRNSVSHLITLPSSEFDALIDFDDDIVLMEPVTTTSSADSVSASSSQEMLQQKVDASNTFVIPSVPLITRPIIKRRKTVIHSSRGRMDLPMDFKAKEQTAISSSSASPSKDKLDETINQVATGNMVSGGNNTEPIIKTSSMKSATSENSLLAASNLPKQKKSQSKSALGQQLLEAIGLKKIPPKPVPEPAIPSSSSSTSITMVPNKQSIQQIRSALKNSLKQAQEQQQRKKELSSTANNTIIQDADSTTKTAVKEIVVVEGKGNKSDNDSNLVDVEEQIDKVTLMVRKNDKEQPLLATTTTSEKEEKKDTKKSALTKIQERRRTMSILAARAAVEKSPKEERPKEEMVVNNEGEHNKSEKEDSENANISSSSAGAASNEANAGNTDEVVTPKRRGRKRLVIKEKELDEDNDDEKNHKTSPSTKPKDEEDAETTKIEEETTSNKTVGRPTRQSKTQSKYYKGPEKAVVGRRSLPSRTTRNR